MLLLLGTEQRRENRQQHWDIHLDHVYSYAGHALPLSDTLLSSYSHSHTNVSSSSGSGEDRPKLVSLGMGFEIVSAHPCEPFVATVNVADPTEIVIWQIDHSLLFSHESERRMRLFTRIQTPFDTCSLCWSAHSAAPSASDSPSPAPAASPTIQL